MGHADDTAQKLASQDWEAITRALVTFAHRRLKGRSLETAREVVQEALTRIWDPDYKDWNPTEQPDLLDHLGSVVNGIVRNIQVSPVERATDIHAPDVVGCLADRVLGGDGRLDERIDAREVVSLLLKRTEEEELVFDVLMLMSEGLDKPAEQAAKLDRPVAEVYKARRRLNEHVAALRAELRKGGDRET